MNTLRSYKPSLVITLSLVAVLVAGCASHGHGMAQNGDECSEAKSTGAGALLGGLIGSVLGGKDGAVKGAVAGAVVGGIGCMAMNYHTKQVKTAQQVNKEYIEANEKLPPQPTVTSYSLSAPHQVVRGSPVAVNSSITVVDGNSQAINSIEEKLYIINGDNERKQIKSKQSEGNMSAGGEYSNSFSFTPPNGVEEGSYRLESEVYVNGTLAKTANTPIVFALNGNGVMTVALLSH